VSAGALPRQVLLGPSNSDAPRGKEAALPRQVLLAPSDSDAPRGKEAALPRQVLLAPSNSDAPRGKGTALPRQVLLAPSNSDPSRDKGALGGCRFRNWDVLCRCLLVGHFARWSSASPSTMDDRAAILARHVSSSQMI
jgi:hypothetical protein